MSASISIWLRLSRGIDRISDGIGVLVGWLTLAMILFGAYNAVVRYGGRFVGWKLSSNAYIELQWYLFSLIFLLGASYALRRGAHVRVDVLYGRLRPRQKAWIDAVGTVLFLFPFCGAVLWFSWPAISNSLEVMEQSPDPGGLPRYPIKLVILVAFVLLAIQAVAELIKRVAFLAGAIDTPDDTGSATGNEASDAGPETPDTPETEARS